MQDKKLNWGILSTGAIAQTFARSLASSQTGALAAVASRQLAKAEEFAAKFGPARPHGSYEALLGDPGVDAVYVAPPHPLHAPLAIAAARAGKHVLVEKPFGVNHAEAMVMFDAAHAAGVTMMEAFMYRCHPQTQRLVELLRDGAIGPVRLIQATFGFQAGFDPRSRLFANDLAGGGILDVGCYAASMARLVAGAIVGKPFQDPIDVKAVGHLGETGVDEWTAAVLRFPGDVTAQLFTSVAVNPENCVRIFGAEGRITVPNPWQANRGQADPGQITLVRAGVKEPQSIAIPADRTSFAYEADAFARAVFEKRREPHPPAMTWDDTLGNLRTLDRWRREIGLTYAMEKSENLTHTVSRRPLARAPDAPMTYGRVEGLEKPVSRLIMGVDNQTTAAHAFAVFDDFFERGGNAFDTAFIYGGGMQEQLLGQWIERRGVRDQVAVIAKGAHTPECNPEALARQLRISLERLRCDHADLYFMHRDNPDIPAGEFVDALNEQLRAGRVRAFGGSNWSLDRVEQANDYARRKGLRGFSAVSNNFSLARMVEPPWGGCIASSDPESRRWLADRAMPLFGWSSQARGFFLPGRAAPQKRDDAELVRCWYADDNFARLRRAEELAAQLGVEPINIALAYVLAQPFPTFALIGPRVIAETRSSFEALKVRLTPDQTAWLYGG